MSTVLLFSLLFSYLSFTISENFTTLSLINKPSTVHVQNITGRFTSAADRVYAQPFPHSDNTFRINDTSESGQELSEITSRFTTAADRVYAQPFPHSDNTSRINDTSESGQELSEITSRFTTAADRVYAQPIPHSDNTSRINDTSESGQELGVKEGLNENIGLDSLPGNKSLVGKITWDKVEDFLKSRKNSVLDLVNSMDVVRKTNASNECKSGFERYFDSLANWETWSVRMADANGKIGSGVLEGALMNLGSFDECLKIRVNSLRDDEVEDFRGQYCMVGYNSPLLRNIYLANGSLNQHYQETYGEPPEWFQDVILRTRQFSKYIGLYLGACVPSSCSEEDLHHIITYVTSPLGVIFDIEGCQTDQPLKWSKSLIAAVSALSTVALLCILGTIADIAKRLSVNQFSEDQKDNEPKSSLMKLLKMFSVVSNVEMSLKSNNRNSFGCFDGMRLFSLLWIMVYHINAPLGTHAYHIYRNLLEFEDYYSGFLFYGVIDNATLALLSFFFISGFLISYALWKRLEKNQGKVNFFKYFLHKYWRLTPAIALTLAIFIVVMHLGSGPLWNEVFTVEIEHCHRYWWKNFIYVGNWWNVDEMCLPWTWFVYCLMQLHIVGFILVKVTYRWPVLGILMGLTVFLGCIALVVAIVIWKKVPSPATFAYNDFDIVDDWGQWLRFRPYYYMQSYIIGMVVGYIVLKYKDKKIKARYQAMGWMLSLIGSLYTVCGAYCLANSPATVTFYFAFAFAAWSASLGWVTYACIAGYGGIINSFLSWKGFHFMSNISYMAYLLHCVVVFYHRGSHREVINYGTYEMVSTLIVVVVISHFLAFISHVTVERPLTHLEKLIF